MNQLTYEFFYKFARFEYTLKTSGYLKSKSEGSNAQPDWNDFITRFENQYQCSVASNCLIDLDPKVMNALLKQAGLKEYI